MSAQTPEQPQYAPQEFSKLRTPESPAKLHSIDEYFSVENEIDFVNKVRETISPEDTRAYVEGDMYKFLGEFAGKVPYTTIRYKKGSQGFDFAGLNLTDSYRSAASNGRREHAEYIGYDKIQQGMLHGAKTAKWISPAKISNYGFMFYFQQEKDNPEWVTEYILRYDEKLGTTGTSQGILDRLTPDECYQTAEDFLYNPVIENGFDDPKRELMHVLKAVGISDADIERSFVYEATVRQMLSRRVDEYTNAVLSGDAEHAKKLRNGIFAAAVEIAQELDKPDDRPGHVRQHMNLPYVQNAQMNKFNNDTTFFGDYANRESKVDGGSCPAIRKNTSNPYSAPNVMEAIKNGTTPEKMAQKEWDYKIPGTCQSCKVEYSEEQAAHNEALGPCHVCKSCEATINAAGDEPSILRKEFAQV